MTQIFYGKSENGQINFTNKKAISDYLASVDKKNLVIKIDREKSHRSLNQNAYYWFYLRLVANDTGHTEDELHQLFKRIFLPPVFIEVLGRQIKTPRTTKDLSKAEFGQYLDKIAMETGIPLPPIKEMTDMMGEYPTDKLTPKF